MTYGELLHDMLTEPAWWFVDLMIVLLFVVLPYLATREKGDQ